jgi:hypothetical protein
MTIPPQKVVSRDLDRAANPGTGARPAKKITNRLVNSTKNVNLIKHVHSKIGALILSKSTNLVIGFKKCSSVFIVDNEEIN